jgi:hypothetical protein
VETSTKVVERAVNSIKVISEPAQADEPTGPARSGQNPHTSARSTIRLEYVPLSLALRWDWVENPKQHDIGGIIDSICRYGFRDPPEYDATLGAFVQGNGRVSALNQMWAKGMDVPRYIGLADGGDWAVPVLFGADAESEATARAYAIDANNLVVTGGDSGFWDIMNLYNKEQMAAIAALAEGPTVTLDGDSLDLLIRQGQDKEQKEGITRWTFMIEYEAEEALLQELEELMGVYFLPRSKRKLMPEFFTAMVRSYCKDQPVVLVD